MMSEKRFVYIEHKGREHILDSPNWDLDYIEMLGDSLEPEEVVIWNALTRIILSELLMKF